MTGNSDVEPPRDVRTLPSGLVVPVRAGHGGPTRKQVRGPHWRRTSHGFYVPSTVSVDDVRQRIVEASVLVPQGGAVTGWAALAWVGARWFDGTDRSGRRLPITIVVGTRDIRPQQGIEISAEGLDPRQVVWVKGVPITRACYAVSFLMRYAPTDRHAIIELEKAAYDDLVSVEEMVAFLATQNGWTGVPRARRAVVRADENVWSPQEGWMLEVWDVDAGLPRPLTNRPVFDLHERHIATPDLIDPHNGVFGEYNGDLHLQRLQNHADLKRESALRRVGLQGATMVSADNHDTSSFIERLQTAYHLAADRPRGPRPWTLEQPSWWTDISTVERRRSLTDEQRARFLRFRSA